MGAESAELTVGYLVKRVQQALRRNCDAALRPIGLSMAQYSVLRALADHPSASAAQLARLCFVTRQSLQDVLNGLRSDGLVDTAPGPSSGRAVPLTLTAPGRRRLAAAHRAVLAVDAAMVAELPAGATGQMTQWLLSCAEELEG